MCVCVCVCVLIFPSDTQVNTLWNVLHSLQPVNTAEWSCQLGVTRKVLIALCGFTVLLTTTYYQANLLKQLLSPPYPPVVTIGDIAGKVATHQSKVVFWLENNDIAVDINSAPGGEMAQLKDALAINPALIEHDSETQMILITEKSAVLIAKIEHIYNLLHYLHPSECNNYVLVDIAVSFPPFYSILLNKQRTKMLEMLNVNIAQRYGFIEQMYVERQPKEECMENLAPTKTPEPNVKGLDMFALSGCFAMFVGLNLCGIFVFCVEIVINKFCRKPGEIVGPSDKLPVRNELVTLLNNVKMTNLTQMQCDLISKECYVLEDILSKWKGRR
jgi:hypothetical protein